jgi:hypothetical protein
MTDDKGGETGFESTDNGGLTWHFWSFAAGNHQPQVPTSATSPPGVTTLAATDARHAWIMVQDPKRNGRCWLYATGDGGATWSKIAVFRTGLPPPRH